MKELWNHQRNIVLSPHLEPDIRYHFFVGGYSSGKTTALVASILDIIRRYSETNLTVAIGADTLVRLRGTVIKQLRRALHECGIAFDCSRNATSFNIDGIDFLLIPLENPENLYGWDCGIFLIDEIDELKQADCIEAFRSAGDRARNTLPDGRAPYVCCFSTAQGYRGLYQIVEELKGRGIPYVLIRGRTKDNKANDPSYYPDRVKIYNDVERMAFLEGRFSNVTTGRVYGDFDVEKHVLKTPPFEINPHDHLDIGQDVNPGYSRGTTIVIRGGVMHVIKLFEFVKLLDAPDAIRFAFPANTIDWWPDSSALQETEALASMFRTRGIQPRVGKYNPSIQDRVLFVNKLFQSGRLVLWPGCERLSMGLTIRQFDEGGRPVKGKGPNDPTHQLDSLEYVVWRLVHYHKEFRDLWGLVPPGRMNIPEVVIA